MSKELSHSTDGRNHNVSFEDFHVLLIQDGESWFARGIEVDYFATGKTIDSVKRNFVKGLIETVKAHIGMFGNLNKLDKRAPDSAWQQYIQSPIDAQKLLELEFDLIPVDEAFRNENMFPWDRFLFFSEPPVSHQHAYATR